jgi:hypothetical protein
MDNQDSGIIAIVGLVLSVGTAVVGAINHKRIRSTCCGKNAEASIDIESTTPPNATVIRLPTDVMKVVESAQGR